MKNRAREARTCARSNVRRPIKRPTQKTKVLGHEDDTTFKIELPKPLRYEELEKLAEERRKEREEKQNALLKAEDSEEEEEAAAKDKHRDKRVNMRPKLKAQEIDFSLSNSRLFECALCMPPKTEEHENQLAEFGADRKNKNVNALFAPRAWCRRIQLSSLDLLNPFYGGQKTVFYKDAKFQEFAPYSQADGLVRCITFYSNPRRNLPEEILFQFEHRNDGLEERVFWPAARRQVERYAPGNPHALREVVTVYGERRELHFYNSRLDGLIKHVELFGKKIYEEFEGRSDGLIEHAMKMEEGESTEEGGETLKIRSLLQYDGEEAPFSGGCKAPAPTEAEWRRQQQTAIELARSATEQQLLTKKIWILRHDGDSSGAAKVDKAISCEGPIDAAAAAAAAAAEAAAVPAAAAEAFAAAASTLSPGAADATPAAAAAATAAAAAEGKEWKPKYPFCSHPTLTPALVDIAAYVAAKQPAAGKEIDSKTAEEIAKRAKNELRLRLMGRAAAIQQQLEEKQEQLKRIKALQKLNELECAIAKDTRLKAMWASGAE
ncbi:hypothetical protein, conserved [Eimeria tenella]|uniref:Dynein regulatory complex subunit 7 MORN domain-containing protein n=1 Tax=Eimeria tenella TaxID=5802 RepID=U6L4T8_EIMTE|nr:hypothetical protein, conserved [Eimeria tenella]CDJ42790.1 hypothetical protein, conserved [Eimeria tenella]|eukprot:XP_013233540.1 hypothetical protein, conserved [Eimeria tenella]